jgi:hypothetical protein
MRLLTRPSTRSPHGPQPRQPVIDRPFPFGWGLNPPSLPSGRLRSGCERSKVPIADEDHEMVSVAALLLALVWPSSEGYRILLMGFAICVGAILAAQASRVGNYFWGTDTRRFRAR